MSKEVYGWGADNVCNFYDTVSDDYQLQANQTFDDPTIVKDDVRVLNQPVKRLNGAWQQPTDEEHNAWIEANQKQYPQPQQQPQGPSVQDKALNALGLQMAQIQKTQATQAQAINALGLQFAAEQNKKTKTENGGN